MALIFTSTMENNAIGRLCGAQRELTRYSAPVTPWGGGGTATGTGKSVPHYCEMLLIQLTKR